MKKLILIVFLLLVSCGSPFIGRVVQKHEVPGWTEITPPGYRYDCSITLEGKFECGYRFFLTFKTEYHSPQYILQVQKDSCVAEVSISKDEYESVQLGDTYTARGYE